MNALTIACSLALALTQTAGSAGTVIGSCPPPDPQQQSIAPGGCFPQQAAPKVEVVFVVDTTGSMGGLIEGAKQKVWSIATTIAQAQPSPTIRMGLVAYRDRGDDYITKRTPMTGDLDALYSDLMKYEARGGGDAPESVNEALFDAVERFDWTEGENVLRIVYLVGDAPPKMEYGDDVKYLASCKLARERGILVNTIQCGTMGGTREVWQEIAQNAGGAYAAIAQDGGVRVCATPYDDELASLDRELSSLMIDYGDGSTLASQREKRDTARALYAATAAPAAADRAVYNQSKAGETNLYGRQELVSDVVGGRVSLDEVPKEQLPENLADKPIGEIRAFITQNQQRRDAISARMGELARARQDFQARALSDAPPSGFDREVIDALREQAGRVGLSIGKIDP